MGWFTRIATALGFGPPLTVREPGPLTLTEAAQAAIAALPAGHALQVATLPVYGLWSVQVQTGHTEKARDPELGIVITPAARDRMKGLALDWDGRWSVKLALRVDAKDTPNPNGRLYLTDRPLARGRPRFFTVGQAHLPQLARRILAIPGAQSVLFRDNALTFERSSDADWAAVDVAVDAGLREHFLACGAEIPEAPQSAAMQGFAATVEGLLRDKIAPAIHHDGGDIELIDVSEDGIVRVHLVGACRTCPASATTLKMGVEAMLREALPGRIQRVEQV